MSKEREDIPMFFSYFEWAIDRRESSTAKGETTHEIDSLNTDGGEKSIVEIDKNYILEGPDGKVGLQDLFDGRGQLIVGYFMFDPSWDQGCPHCSAGADEISDNHLKYLHDRDTSFVYISRAPLEKIEAYKQQKDWSFPWYSSYGSDFNYDFKATTDDGEVPGGSVFRRDGDSIFQVNNNEAP